MGKRTAEKFSNNKKKTSEEKVTSNDSALIVWSFAKVGEL